MNLYNRHVPDDNVFVVSTREKDIDKFFNSELGAFLCRYGHIVVVLSRRPQNVSLVRKCVFWGGGVPFNPVSSTSKKKILDNLSFIH